MTIAFKTIPSSLRVPGFYAEIDASQANTASQPQRALIIGQVTSGSTLTPNVPVISASAAEARIAGGAGSILALMAAAYRGADAFGELWYLPVADDPSATAATGTIAFSGTATAAGTLALYIAGQLVTVGVTVGMTAAQLATAVVAAVTAAIDLPVTAAAATGTVTLTAKNKGLCGNDLDIRLNYRGSAGGEATPAGITANITAMSGGATNPSLTAALAALSDLPFDFIISPYGDSTSRTAISALLNDTTGRWSWSSELYGHCFTAQRGTQGNLASFGVTLNDQHLSCMGFYDSPSPNFVWAAAVAGATAVSIRADPALPLQTLAVPGVLPPPVQSRFLLSQRNTLLFDGISTFRVDQSGQVLIENLITTYQTNASGQPDNSYLEVETMFTLMAVLRTFSGIVSTKFARVKIGQDGVRYPAGSGVVTPSTIKAELVANYRTMEEQGLVQNSDGFATAVTVTKNAQNPSRVDVLLPITLIGQLRVFATLLQFRLS